MKAAATRRRFPARHSPAWLVVGLALLAPGRVLAHCDTLDGPVVRDARAAIEARDVTPVLKWVSEAKEPEVREAFRHTLAVRALAPEALAMADRYFFETLVRVHREGEGAPYTGLRPTGAPVDPAVAATDEALDRGDVDSLVRAATAAAGDGLRSRFGRAAEAKRHADRSVAQGRAYVAAYVELIHYAERLLQLAAAPSSTPDAVPAPGHHDH